jgi:hypothetical protein
MKIKGRWLGGRRAGKGKEEEGAQEREGEGINMIKAHILCKEMS